MEGRRQLVVEAGAGDLVAGELEVGDFLDEVLVEPAGDLAAPAEVAGGGFNDPIRFALLPSPCTTDLKGSAPAVVERS